MTPPPRTARGPFLGWPGWSLVAEALLLGTAQTLWWCIVYVGADWLTGWRTDRVRVHLDAELDLPFVPALLLVYRSIDVMFPLAPFVLRSRTELRCLTAALASVTALAGIGFVLLPAEPAYPPQDPAGWESLIDWNRRIVRSYNMVPSLHVALSVVTLSAYGARCGTAGKTALTIWGIAIALSTLLAHQHHLLDVVTGLLLGCFGYWLYRRWLDASPAAQNVPANLSSDRGPPA